MNRSRCASLRRNNVTQAQEFVLPFRSRLLLKKFIDNISGFFGMKPSSENPALLQSCKFTSMKENAGKCHFFRKNVDPFHRNCVDRGFCLSG